MSIYISLTKIAECEREGVDSNAGDLCVFPLRLDQSLGKMTLFQVGSGN